MDARTGKRATAPAPAKATMIGRTYLERGRLIMLGGTKSGHGRPG